MEAETAITACLDNDLKHNDKMQKLQEIINQRRQKIERAYSELAKDLSRCERQLKDFNTLHPGEKVDRLKKLLTPKQREWYNQWKEYAESIIKERYPISDLSTSSSFCDKLAEKELRMLNEVKLIIEDKSIDDSHLDDSHLDERIRAILSIRKQDREESVRDALGSEFDTLDNGRKVDRLVEILTPYQLTWFRKWSSRARAYGKMDEQLKILNEVKLIIEDRSIDDSHLDEHIRRIFGVQEQDREESVRDALGSDFDRLGDYGKVHRLVEILTPYQLTWFREWIDRARTYNKMDEQLKILNEVKLIIEDRSIDDSHLDEHIRAIFGVQEQE